MTTVPEKEATTTSTDVVDSSENKTSCDSKETDNGKNSESEHSKKRQRDDSDAESGTEYDAETLSSNPNKTGENDSNKKQRVIDRQICEDMNTQLSTGGNAGTPSETLDHENERFDQQEPAANLNEGSSTEADIPQERADGTKSPSDKDANGQDARAHSNAEQDKAPDIANDTDNVKASQSIFSGLFRHDMEGSGFSNPFQKQAAEGEGGFLSNRPAAPVETEDEIQEENIPFVDINTGEEDEDVKFEETRVTLKKFIAKESGEKPKWQGGSLGRLKLLQHKKQAHARRSRVLMRNVGTLDLLINSPIELAKSLTKQDTTSNKYCAIFSAINQGTDEVIPHCVVFDARDRRDLFISTFDEIRNQF